MRPINYGYKILGDITSAKQNYIFLKSKHKMGQFSAK